jgi:lipid II:glycine glycyltransferase (peptidoglycan interpeptide bridge formation enzyme)
VYEFNEIDETRRDEYNQAAAVQPFAHVFQSYEWGEVKAWSGWQPHRFLVTADGKTAGAVQALERPIPKIKASILYVPCGPAADLAAEGFADAFTEHLKGLAKRRNAAFVKVDPPIPDDQEPVKEALGKAGFKRAGDDSGGFEGIQPRCVMHLDITGSDQDVLSRMTEKWRYNIRLSGRKGVTVRQGGPDDIQKFYDILTVTGQRDGFLIRNKGYFDRMYKEMAEKDMLRLFVAEHEGEPIAATIALAFSDKCWYTYGASGNVKRNLMPNHALQWAMIQWARERGCPVYDFRGVPCDLSPEHPLYGLVRFKTGFGAYPVKYIGEYELVFKPMLAQIHKRGMPLYTAIRKKLRS